MVGGTAVEVEAGGHAPKGGGTAGGERDHSGSPTVENRLQRSLTRGAGCRRAGIWAVPTTRRSGDFDRLPEPSGGGCTGDSRGGHSAIPGRHNDRSVGKVIGGPSGEGAVSSG